LGVVRKLCLHGDAAKQEAKGKLSGVHVIRN
jgi:hypothetical protein